METENTTVKITPYGGNKPYIFISYSHRNKADVEAIIYHMQQSGYNVWYDAGIDPGTEWDENIAAHVIGCRYFIAFISPEYLESQNCKDEINYARDLNKDRLLVYLSPTELPDGMNMRLNRLQAIHKYSYKNEHEFYKKLFTAKNINICLENTANLSPNTIVDSNLSDNNAFCYKCGCAISSPGNEFCENCGVALKTIDSFEPTPSSALLSKTYSTIKKKWIIIIPAAAAVVLGLAVTLIVVNAGNQNNRNKVNSPVFSAVENNDSNTHANTTKADEISQSTPAATTTTSSKATEPENTEQIEVLDVRGYYLDDALIMLVDSGIPRSNINYISDNGKSIIVKNNWVVYDMKIENNILYLICTKGRNSGIIDAFDEVMG